MPFALFLVIYEISTYLSNDMYLPALPQMVSELSLTTQQAQLTLTVWFIGMACTPLLFGAISDRFGRRPILLAGGLVFILTSIICAMTSDITTLLVTRFIQGCAIPSMMVAGYACIHELYDHKEAIRILAIMGSVTVLAPAFGPLLGALLLYLGSWRLIFIVIALMASIAICFLFYRMPETHTVDKHEPLHLGNLFASYWRVLTNKAYMLQLAILAALFSGFIVWITVSPFLVISSFHYSTIAFGLFQAFIFIFYIIGNQSVDYLMEKIGIKSLIRLGLTFIIVGGMAVSLTAWCFPNTLYPFIASMTIYSIGSALCFAPLNRTIIEASTERMGVRVAIFTVILMLSLAFTSAIAGQRFDGTILSLALLTSVGAVVAYTMWLLCPSTPD